MSRRVYVDIDDVLAHTIERLVELLDETHGRRVDVEDVRFFNLERSFDLDPQEIRAFMDRAHSDEEIEAIKPVDGAANVLSDWHGAGHEVHLVTGRPPATNEASRRWLERHAIPHVSLHHLDKWGRPTWNESGLPALRFEDLPDMAFAFAVEDSLDTAIRLAQDLEIPVALVDRPWNRDTSGLSGKAKDLLRRCLGWRDVAALAREVD